MRSGDTKKLVKVSFKNHHVQATKPLRPLHGVPMKDSFTQKQQSFLQKLGQNPIVIGCLFFSVNFIYIFLNKWILVKYCNYPMVTLNLLGQVLMVIVWKELTYKPTKINYVEPKNSFSNFYSAANQAANFDLNSSHSPDDKILRNSNSSTKRKYGRKSQKIERRPKVIRYNHDCKKYPKAGSTYEFTKQDIKILMPVAFFQMLYLTLVNYALKKLNIADRYFAIRYFEKDGTFV